jgi:hypothetical protein
MCYFLALTTLENCNQYSCHMDPSHLHILKIKLSAGVLSELLKFVIVVTLVNPANLGPILES